MLRLGTVMALELLKFLFLGHVHSIERSLTLGLLSKVRVRLCPCSRWVPGLTVTVEEEDLHYTQHLQG